MPEFDERDGEILAERQLRRERITGPRVGDFVWMTDGELRRFAHHWGDRIQPTSGPSKGPRDIGAGGSFHLCRNGGVEHSGGLDQGIPIDRLRPTDRAVFVLRFMEALALEEVAAALDISLATTKRRLARGWSKIELM